MIFAYQHKYEKSNLLLFKTLDIQDQKYKDLHPGLEIAFCRLNDANYQIRNWRSILENYQAAIRFMGKR